MTEHYTRNTVSVSAWCPKCQKQTMHRVDAGHLGPCLPCMENAENAHAVMPTGCFFCPDCNAWTIHRMENGGWSKGPCLDCEARTEQGNLFSA